MSNDVAESVLESQRALMIVMQGLPFTRHTSKFDTKAMASTETILDPSLFEFISANPIKSGHTRCPCSEGNPKAHRWENVASYQNWVLEIDEHDLQHMDADEWEAAIMGDLEPVQSITSITIFSGGKSVHNFITTTTPVDRDTWVRTAIGLSKLVPNADRNVLFQPNRLVRMPNGRRENGRDQFVDDDMKNGIPFENVKQFLMTAGVWDENASLDDIVPKKPNPIAEGEWERKNSLQAAVRGLCLEHWSWSNGRTHAFYRDGGNKTSLADLVVCAYDHGDEAEDPALSWTLLAEKYLFAHPEDAAFAAKLEAIPSQCEQQLKKGIDATKKMLLENRLSKAAVAMPQQFASRSWESVTNDDVLRAL
ncbi:MAG: hypothetical protein AAB288_09415, partial [Acidobacteriota bacterium]